MAKRLSKKQKIFADHYLETGNGTQSALKAYEIEGKAPAKTASVMAVETLASLSVMQYLQDNAKGAASRIVQMSIEANNEAVKLNANKDVLDRAGYKPPEKSEVSHHFPQPILGQDVQSNNSNQEDSETQ